MSKLTSIRTQQNKKNLLSKQRGERKRKRRIGLANKEKNGKETKDNMKRKS
jgi:hypothetical protein